MRSAGAQDEAHDLLHIERVHGLVVDALQHVARGDAAAQGRSAAWHDVLDGAGAGRRLAEPLSCVPYTYKFVRERVSECE